MSDSDRPDDSADDPAPSRRPRRPFLFVLALSLSVVVGWGGVANGCNTVQFYRSAAVTETPLRPGVDAKKQEEAAAVERAINVVHDHARKRRLPLGVANLLLSGLLVFAATRALGGRPGARLLTQQALAANGALAVSEFALLGQWRREVVEVVRTHAPKPDLKGTEGVTEEQVMAMLSPMMNATFLVGLGALLLLYAVAFLTLRSASTVAYFDAMAEAEEEADERDR
jgi:hypothetical protein